MRLFPASLILAFVAVPAAAQQYMEHGGESIRSSKYEGRIENFANCVVRTDTVGAAAYVRTERRSAAEGAAIEKLAPAYAACDWHVTRWGGKGASEWQKRSAILIALHRYRNQVAGRN